MKAASAWMATSGAAFSSAMGRQSLGSTNALLAVLSIDLGIWLPSPRKVADGYSGFGRVRLGYLVKEILGMYDRNDDYVFVSDGGHWENLGLVELIRRRANPIICIDASGDEPGTYQTLREAVDLAATDLDDEVTIDLSALDETGPMTPPLVVQLPFHLRPAPDRPGEPVDGIIYYAKLQMSPELPKAVRRFAHSDPRFPHYSTSNQFLDDQQFAHLLAAGRSAGERLADVVAVEEQPQ
jgi:hypothetical protein